MGAERATSTPVQDGAPPPASHPFRGALLCVAGVFFFACLDTTTKYLVASYDVPLVAAIRYIVNCALMAAILGPRFGVQLVQTQRTGLVLLRGLSLTVLTLFVSLALQRMPVAETTSILFLAPLLVVVLAGPILGERVRPLSWVAAITGFSGVLLIARPGGGLEAAGILFAALAAAANVAYQLLSRVLVHTERMIALLFHGTLVGSICFGITLPWFATGVSPTLLQGLLFLSLGVCGWLSHYFFTAAYRHASASLLAPVNYLQLLWAGLLGWLVFGHVPDSLTVLGMCVVALSGAMIAIISRRP